MTNEENVSHVVSFGSNDVNDLGVVEALPEHWVQNRVTLMKNDQVEGTIKFARIILGRLLKEPCELRLVSMPTVDKMCACRTPDGVFFVLNYSHREIQKLLKMDSYAVAYNLGILLSKSSPVDVFREIEQFEG